MTALASGEIYPGIVVDQEILAGTPVIAGTRVPVEIILGSLAAGDTAEALQRSYDLTEENIRAALGYAASVIASEKVYVFA